MADVTRLGGGRPRKPSALRARQTKETRAEPRVELVPVPPPPGHLDDRERAAWLDLKALVDPLGVFTLADAVAFEAMAAALATARAAQEALRANGHTFEGLGSRDQVVVRARPEVGILLNAQKALLLWMSRFGLSPSDRSRVTGLEAPPPADPAGRRERMEQFS